MKNLTKCFILFASTFLYAGACEPTDGWDGGGPITRYLLETWKLEKVVTPKRTVWDKQIGYSEILKISYADGFHIEETYRNDTLTGTKYWRIDPAPVTKTKDMTVSVTYRYDFKRFYKLHRTVSQPTVLEASAYLPELGTAADSVKYFYREVW